MTGVVDKHVDAAERSFGRRDRLGDLAGIGHVERYRDGPITELLGEVLHRLDPSRGHNHAVAVLECGAGDRTAESGGAPGDQPAGHQAVPSGSRRRYARRRSPS